LIKDKYVIFLDSFKYNLCFEIKFTYVLLITSLMMVRVHKKKLYELK